jgi:outer membrane scaffolding protein for murein synthesis (MipA/OmpV family)
MPAVAMAQAAAQAAAPQAEWSGALGLNLSYRPEYDGGSRHAVVARPAIYLRYGRFSLSSGASFAARRTDDVVRGLGVDLVRGTRTRISLALRHDSGRQEGDSDALRGLGDVNATVRARVSARRQLDERWRVAASWNVDAFGRGGGSFADAQLTRDWPLSPQTVASAAVGVTVGGRRYMRSYYGVNEVQSAASGYPVYQPRLGLRDASLSASVRTDLGDDWTLLVGGGLSRLLGPAADSPLTTRRDSWGLNAGLARRF